MHAIVEFLSAALLWFATLAFSHLGVDIERTPRHEPKAERVIQRLRAPADAVAVNACPDNARAVTRPVARTV